MIYFLVNWKPSNNELESDVSFLVNRLFHNFDIQIKTINTREYPFLNFDIREFNNNEGEDPINILDIVTTKSPVVIGPVILSDLNFPRDWEITFTLRSVLFSINGQVKAEVFFNSYGFVSEVIKHKKTGQEKTGYSEKGIIRYKNYYDTNGIVMKEIIYDDNGNEILSNFINSTIIEKKYQDYFKYKVYNSYKEVCTELLDNILNNFNPDQDNIIIDGTDKWIMSLIKQFKFPELIVLFFSGPTHELISAIQSNFDFIVNLNFIITDNYLLKKIVSESKELSSIKDKIRCIPFYSTSLMLGKSNNSLKMEVYWQIDNFDEDLINLFEDFLKMKIHIKELQFCIEIDDESFELKIDTVLKKFITSIFRINLNSTEYDLVKNYYEAKKNKQMTPDLRDQFNEEKNSNSKFRKTIDAYHFYVDIRVVENSNMQLLKDNLQRARVFVDHRQKNNYLSHSLAVSAGIPILSRSHSPYLIDSKNGTIYSNNKQLVSVVRNYLINLDYWNKSLVESIDIIEKNSPECLIKKWSEFLK